MFLCKVLGENKNVYSCGYAPMRESWRIGLDTTVVLNCFQLRSLATIMTLCGGLSEKSGACLAELMKKLHDKTSGEFRLIEWIRFIIFISCAELRDLCELN